MRRMSHAKWPLAMALGVALSAAMHGGSGMIAQATPRRTAALVVPRQSGTYTTGTFVTEIREARHVPFAPPGVMRVLRVQVWYPAVARRGAPASPYLAPAVARSVARAAGVFAAQLSGVRARSAGGAPPARGRFPVVVFSPGYGEPSALYTGLLEDLASRGFVVMGVDHTYETSIVALPRGQLIRATLPQDPPSRPSLLRAAITARDADIALVRRRVAQIVGRLGEIVERGRVGVFGHSLGGLTGAHAVAGGGFACGADLDGSVFSLRARIERPFMVLSHSTRDASVRRFWNTLHGARYWFVLRGARHLDFTDWSWLYPHLTHRAPSGIARLLGGIGGLRAQAIERQYLGAFFRSCLRGKQEPLLTTDPPPFSEVRSFKSP